MARNLMKIDMLRRKVPRRWIAVLWLSPFLLAGCASVPNVRLSQSFPSSLPPPSLKPSSFLSPPPALLGVAPNAFVLDQNMHQATVHQWNFSIQRQLPYDMVLQVAYVGNRGEKLYSQLGANQIGAAPILPQFLSMQLRPPAPLRSTATICATSGPAPISTRST